MSEPVFEHNPGDHEDPLSGPTWIIGILGAVLLIVIGLGLTALFYNAQHQQEVQKIVERDPLELENLRASQHKVLAAGPVLVEEMEKVEGQDQERLVTAIHIPIDSAIEVTLKEYSQKTTQ